MDMDIWVLDMKLEKESDFMTTKEEFYGNRCGIPGLWVEGDVDSDRVNVLRFETGDVSAVDLNVEQVLKLRNVIDKWLENECGIPKSC